MPLHHLMVGTWTPPGAVFTFQFDDETLELKLVKRTELPHDEPISWMTFDHAKKNIYGAALKRWISLAVRSPTDIARQASHPMTHHPAASLASTNTRAIFLLAARKPPYAVYANPFYAHAEQGTVFAVTPETPEPSSSSSTTAGGGGDGAADDGAAAPSSWPGTLAGPVQHYPYGPGTGVHGMVFDPTETYLYSADLQANKLWVHRRGGGAGAGADDDDPSLTLVGSVAAPDPGDHPRWVAMHPTGQYLYALMEAGNRLCEYVVDPATRLPVHTHHSYPLIPPGLPTRDPSTGKGLYRADVCALSSSGRYLFASSRANRPDLAGYLAAFALRPCGSVERQLCLLPTPTSGGHSNAVSPCDWSDEWLAVTDDQEGWLDMYRWKDEFLSRVARVRVQEPGFGMNAIWYD